MKLVNISTGARGAYIGTQLVMVEPGQTAEGDFTDVNDEWFDDGSDGALSSNTVKELKAIAEAEGIDLGDATNKADIIAAIELAREPK
jgi:hypothetical protein